MLTIGSELDYRWFGIEQRLRLPDHIAVSETPARKLLISSLTRLLYNNVYSTGHPQPIGHRTTTSADLATLVWTLTAANQLEDRWELQMGLLGAATTALR